MKVPGIVAFGGAAMLILSGTAGAMSNRAEREETRQLNLQQAQAAQQANDSGRIAAVTDSSLPGAPPAAAPTQRIQVADAAPVAGAQPTPSDAMAPADTKNVSASAPLSSITPPSKIATANVMDSSGQIVGAVQRVQLSPEGKAMRVDIALIGLKGQVVSVDAASLSYDLQNNLITAQASAAQLKALPHKG